MLLQDAENEIARTRVELSRHLPGPLVQEISSQCASQAAEIVQSLVTNLDRRLAHLYAQANVQAEESPHQRQRRITEAIRAADARGLYHELIGIVTHVTGSYGQLMANVAASNPRLVQLTHALTLDEARSRAIVSSVAKPLAPVMEHLRVHAERCAEALETLRPGMATKIVEGAVLLGSALIGGPLAALVAREAVGERRNRQHATRFGAFLAVLRASLDELRSKLIETLPEVMMRSRAALFALQGGFVASASLLLRRFRTEVASVDLRARAVTTRLSEDAWRELAAWAENAFDAIRQARRDGRWIAAVTWADHAIAVYAPFPERWSVALHTRPAVHVLNEERARAYLDAAGAAVAERRADARMQAKLLHQLVSGAATWWARDAGLPEAGAVCRRLLALEGAVVDPELRASYLGGPGALALRSEHAPFPPSAQPDHEDLTLMRAVANRDPSAPHPSATGDLTPLSPWRAWALGRVLVREAKQYGAPLGSLALDLRSRGRRAALQLGGGLALGAMILGGAVALTLSQSPSRSSRHATTQVAQPSTPARPEQPQAPPPVEWIPADAVASALRPLTPRVRRCAGARVDTLRVELSVDASGTVVGTVVPGPRAGNAVDIRCVDRVVRSARFAAASGGARQAVHEFHLASRDRRNRQDPNEREPRRLLDETDRRRPASRTGEGVAEPRSPPTSGHARDVTDDEFE